MRGRRESESRCSTETASGKPAKPSNRDRKDSNTSLNAGSGNAYKPGFVNIDSDGAAVVDIRADVLHLPFRDRAFDTVEADQLLEHFDTAHVRVLLAELHRVLRTGGTLVIETPDTEKAFKRLSTKGVHRHDAELQWIYGIDSPGLGHKTGFTKRSLKDMLRGHSFDDVKFEEQRTHKYEPGIRATCRRREYESKVDSAVARAVNALTLRREFGDSFFLIPLEEELAGIRGSVGQDYAGLISRACVLNPTVALALEDALSAEGVSLPTDGRDLLKALEESEFHQRAFTLWKKSARTGGGREEFREFTERLSEDVRECLLDGRQRETRLKYVLSLDPIPIRLLEHRLVMVQGQKAASEGIRRYLSGMRGPAAVSFKDALAINPDDFCAAMNLARLMANREGPALEADDAYSKAVRSAPKSLKASIAREMSEYERTGRAPDSPYVAS